MPKALRRLLPPMVGLILCAALGLLVIRPAPGVAELRDLTQRFEFDVHQLNSAPANSRAVRPVAPQLDGLNSWISAVGAAVALADLRGLGRAADACLVDPRDDSVTLRPVPQAGGADYPPALLHPDGLPYDHTMAPMGCVPVDLDEDGDQDIIVYYWGRSPVVFLNRGGPAGVPSARQFQPVELITPMEIWNSTGLNVADVDGDGHLDIFVANYFPDGAKVLDPAATEDQRMAMQHSMALAANGGSNRLLLTQPTGTADQSPALVDASAEVPAQAAMSWTLAVGFQDLTGDQLPEIYLGNDFGPDHLLVNHSTPGKVRLDAVVGDRDLVTPKSQVVGRDSFKGMGVAFTYDRGETLPIIVVSNITTPYALHESNFAFVPDGDGRQLLDGDVPFTNRSEQLSISRSGWGWDVKAGDFDNDGVDELLQATGFIKGDRDYWPKLQELAMGNDDLLRFPVVWPRFVPGGDLSGHEHNPFWVRRDDGRYADLAPQLGIGAPDVSRGLAFGDVDGDGRLDVLVANQWEDSRVLMNRSTAGNSATLRLEIPVGDGASSRPAIGAQVVVHSPDGDRRAQLFPANGHAGVSAAELHVALPDGPSRATVTWRAGTEVHRATLAVNPGRHTVLLTADGSAVLR
ncbi:CRTAC1 family protein [Micromonospora sp. LOL_021]|uniref:CRTAC1 family protein n=1 Tax=Micromonospora sp. LOL_021 TaxID=3345417 RepID=UPI003A878556